MSSITSFRLFRSCCKSDILNFKISARASKPCSVKRVSGSLKRLAKIVCLKLGSAEGLTSTTSSGLELEKYLTCIGLWERKIINPLNT